MAKDEIGGVWRTVGGRRIFIKDGEDLETAMKNSGKFGKKKEKQKDDEDFKKTIENLDNDDIIKYLKYDKQNNPEFYNEKNKKDIDDEFDKRYNKKSSLPQKTEIKEQGNSNRLAVKENIQAHILEFYDDPQDFIDTMDNMSHLSSDWKRGEEIAKGGTYLLYNQDMADFLDELKINPKGKKFSEDKAYEMYTSLIGRESANLYKRLKNKK